MVGGGGWARFWQWQLLAAFTCTGSSGTLRMRSPLASSPTERLPFRFRSQASKKLRTLAPAVWLSRSHCASCERACTASGAGGTSRPPST